MKQYKDKAISVLEDVIVIVVTFGLFLPIRLLFVEYVSDSWIGSFGLITAVVVVLVLLSKKNKLGFFGRAYWRTISRVHKGKRRIFSYIMIGITLYLWASMVYGIEFAKENPEAIELKLNVINTMTEEEIQKMDRLSAAIEGLDVLATHDELLGAYQEIPFDLLILSAVMLILMPVLDFTIWAVIVSMIDTWLNGWLLHFGTVFLIEVIEVIGVMIFTYHTTRKDNNKAKDNKAIG